MIKLFYSNSNLIVDDPEELFEFYHSSYTAKPFFNSITKEQDEVLKEHFLKLYDEKFGASTTTPITWEVLICIAKK